MNPNMKDSLLFCLLFALTVFAGSQIRSSSAEPSKPSATSQKLVYVLVHGAWGGGWDWKHMDQLLTSDGNTVYRVTLSGMGEHSNFSSTNIDLDTHIQDVVNVILWEDLHDVVLVGHSYGGMVITGVADRIPDRIRHVFYLDALLPENGESEETSRPHRTNQMKMPANNGYIIPFWVRPNQPPPHDVPQPAKTFSEPITLTNQAVAQKIPTTYILAVDPGKTPEQDDFYAGYQRAQNRGWRVVAIESDHNVQRSHPQELRKLLEEVQ